MKSKLSLQEGLVKQDKTEFSNVGPFVEVLDMNISKNQLSEEEKCSSLSNIIDTSFHLQVIFSFNDYFHAKRT